MVLMTEDEDSPSKFLFFWISLNPSSNNNDDLNFNPLLPTKQVQEDMKDIF
jgi:hypothetical protein